MNDKPDIIIDLGSDYVKAGFAGEEKPRVLFPTVVGKPKVPGIMVGLDQRDYFIGKEAEEKRNLLILQFPVEHGMIENWDNLEKILHYTFSELGVTPDEHNVLILDSPMNPKSNREKLTQLLLDSFNVSGFYTTTHAVSALYSAERETGVVVTIGESIAHVVPIVDGQTVLRAIRRINLAGRDLTDYMMSLGIRGYNLNSSEGQRIAKKIKEKTGYVALDFDEELKQSKQGNSTEKVYKMPDGSELTVSNERFQTPEILFTPSLLGRDIPSIHKRIHEAIQLCDSDVRLDLYQTIVLAGGSTLFPGFAERLTKELQKIAPQNIASKVKVIASPERQYSAWLGAGILSSTPTFTSMWISQEEYQDEGPSIVNRKCFQ